MKNKLLSWNMRKTALVAVCIQSSFGGMGICYASEVNVQMGAKVKPGMELVSYSNQQSKTNQVVGVVTDGNGEPIIGATVQVKGGSHGVITDFDGRYTIVVPDANAILVGSYI